MLGFVLSYWVQCISATGNQFREACDPSWFLQGDFPLSRAESITFGVPWRAGFQWFREFLEVFICFSSINLVPCSVSFSNLTYFEVDSCKNMLYLFTSPTAISLTQLKTMKVRCCNSIEEIVSKEGDESNGDEIIFQQLNCLKLKGLPNLRSFYKGNLSFPSLEELSVIHCNRMETVSRYCKNRQVVRCSISEVLRCYPIRKWSQLYHAEGIA